MKNYSILNKNSFRTKYCEICKIDYSTMYRIQFQPTKEWVFSCKNCLSIVKKDNKFYRYGGTWKK
ncbi:MAG: hypothetical protein P8P25_00230 [Flavobacteriaceae bacterium]|nr:hypothetical protein [Flavobacteriaceae bacterium]MBT7573905.1 hypothetical protein [Flavobacteriaceae bacterium]MDA7567474.1 hypothetical protein [Flavobacteriaceae bacterium]MDC0554519.1 hypothetical protein [Flavobacteriaceae bacterium]MDG1031089.1 hypothetical protein [Flavobacteriaceae bacterium]